jgi:hypothetical protein
VYVSMLGEGWWVCVWEEGFSEQSHLTNDKPSIISATSSLQESQV